MALNHKLQDVLDRAAAGEDITEITLSHGMSCSSVRAHQGFTQSRLTPSCCCVEPLTPTDMTALTSLMERTPKLLILRLQSEWNSRIQVQ